MLKPFLLCCLIFAPTLAAAADQPDAVVSFETDRVPDDIQASSNSTLQISRARYIDGKRSLRWTWEGGPAWITINRPIPYQPGPQRLRGNFSDDTFSPWIYTHQPMDGELRFTFGRQGNPEPDCGFRFGMSFTGWRTGWLMFTRDMQGKPTAGMNQVRIRTPRGVDHGELFLDSIVLASIVDARHQYPDRQVPYVNQDKAPAQHWLPRLELLDLAPSGDQATASQPQLQAVETIEQRVEGNYVSANTTVSDDRIDQLLAKFRSYDIEMGPDGVRGRHINFTRQSMVYPEPIREEKVKQFVGLRGYQEHMLAIAKACRARNISAGDRHRLQDAFVLMARHLLDQGWAEGSVSGTVHHLGYSFREIGPATLLMRDTLAKHDLLKPLADAILWYFNTYTVFEPGSIHSNMDYYNTLARGHLVSILLMPDGPAKVATLTQYSKMVSDILDDQTPGTENGFKIDGTAFHHFGHYPAYATGAFANGSVVIRMLAGTPFEISPAGRANFRHALMTMRLYANPDWAIGFAGRHPIPHDSRTAGMSGLRDAFVNLAFSGNPKTGAPVDRGVLAAALRIWPDLAENPKIAKLDVKPEATPQGHWTLNYAAAGIHRDGSKTVTLKGYNNNVWSSEIYTRDNRFGRYQSNGSIAILNRGGNAASGFSQDGWDWNHIPGTTGVDLPLDQLEAPGNGTVMLNSPNPFAGDSNLDGKYGVFAINLYDQKLPGSKGLTAHKSAFCFGPRIVCLGTSITSPNTQHPTQTTLFQTHLKKTSDPIWLNDAKPITRFPMALDRETKKPATLVDPYGNGYYIPAGQALNITRQHQHSRNDKTEKPTEGDFASAWLDHGPAPSDARYRYAVVLGADIQQMQHFARDMQAQGQAPYRVLRQDDAVHAVHDRATGVTGIAVFEPSGDLRLDGCAVVSVSVPSLIMTQRTDRDALNLSVCDPSLHLKNGKSQPTEIELRLAGRWTGDADQKNVQATASDKHTMLTVTVRQAQPVQIRLKSGPEPVTASR